MPKGARLPRNHLVLGVELVLTLLILCSGEYEILVILSPYHLRPMRRI